MYAGARGPHRKGHPMPSPEEQDAQDIAARRSDTRTDAEKVAAIHAMLHELHLDLQQLYTRYGRERPRLHEALADRLSQFSGDVRDVVQDVL
jgi:hypothetical protein